MLEEGINKLRPHRDRYADELIYALILYATNLGFDRQDSAFDAISEADELAREEYGESSLQRAGVQVRLASSLTWIRKFDESERNFKAALPVLESQLGRDHSRTVTALSNFAFMYMNKGDDERAEAIFLELLERQKRLFGPGSRAVADTSQNLGAMYITQERYSEAVALLHTAYHNYREVLNDGNYVIAYPLLTLAYAELQRGNAAAAEMAAAEALSRFMAAVPDSFLRGVAQCLVGVSLEHQGKADEGTPLVLDSHPYLGQADIGDHYRALCRYTP